MLVKQRGPGESTMAGKSMNKKEIIFFIIVCFSIIFLSVSTTLLMGFIFNFETLYAIKNALKAILLMSPLLIAITTFVIVLVKWSLPAVDD